MKREFPKTWGMSATHPGTQAFLAQRYGVPIAGPWLERRDEEDDDQSNGEPIIGPWSEDDEEEEEDDDRELAKVAEELHLDINDLRETAVLASHDAARTRL
jgi:hypothetical protein